MTPPKDERDHTLSPDATADSTLAAARTGGTTHWTLPDSLIGFLAGDPGTPPGGWPEPFRSKALAGLTVRPATAALAAEDAALLATGGRERRKTLNRLLFPGPTKEYETHRATYGDTSVLDTLDALYGLRRGVEHVIHLEPGVDLIAGLEAVSDVDEHGMRTVLATLNGSCGRCRCATGP